ncbi:MAG TPA: twin-arginine translocase TatA/TatE family subunit [Pirellulales bacterium]|jgi:sec-independent protein translocase protein TatA
MFGLNPMELLMIGGLAVLLFGSRLPSVARSLGKSMTEFKKGLHGIEEEANLSSRPSTRVNYAPADDREESTVQKFEPPTSEPSVSQQTADERAERHVEA